MLRHHARLFASLLALAVTPASAATWIWPDLLFSTPCAGTLQACINHAGNGDTILIGNDSIAFPDRYTGITGGIAIGKSLTLMPMEGINAVFEGGSITIVTPPGVVGDVTLRRLVLRGGRITAQDGGSTAATITLDQLSMIEPPAGVCAIDFVTSAATVATPRFIVSNSRLTMTEAGGAVRDGICAFTSARSYQADFFGNRIDASRSSGSGGFFLTAGPGAGAVSIRLQRNRILLSRTANDRGIFIQHNNPAVLATVELANNVVSGAGGAAGSENAAIVVKERNAEVNIINNSITAGGVGIHVDAMSGGTISGRVANNLVADQSVRGLRFLGVAVPNDHNLLHDVGANELGPGGVLGAGTLTTDPLLESPLYPRPLAGSPAIDAGDNGAVPAFTLFDADGEKRQQGVVDIGAIEFSFDGTRIHDATSANTFGNDTALDAEDYPFALFTTDRLVVSPLRAAPGLSAGSANLGVYQSDGLVRRWAIFNQDLSTIPTGRRYAVLLPWDSRTAVLHTVAAGNIPGTATAETEIDHASLNNQPAAIAVVTPNWNPANTPGGTYHDHPITLVYRGSRWRIRNDDAASMNSAIGAAFNLAVAPLFSPNAFMAELGGFAAAEIPLRHPLLDDNPCAAPVASRRVQFGDASLTLNSTPFSLEYRPPLHGNDIGRWYIVAEDALGFSANNAFNVVVDGAQANRCLAPRPDALFADGFE